MNHLVPKYYNKFMCIGSDCPETCCQGWKISLDKDTFNKYQKLDKADLKIKSSKFLKKYPREVKGFYGQITMKNGTCPFLGQDKLCSIQKEYGNSFLSTACAQYPRKISVLDDKKLKSLGMGCPESARLVLFDKNAMNLVENNFYEVKKFVKLYDKRNIDEVEILGEKLFNLAFFLIKNDKISIKSSLCIIKKLLEERPSLEFFPERLDDVYNYLMEQFKNDEFLKFDTSGLNIEFLKHFYKFASDQNSNAKDSSGQMSKNFIKSLDSTFESLVLKFNSSEEQYKNFYNLKIKLSKYIRNEYPYLFKNYFLNELFSNASMFTSRKPFSENRLDVSLLGALIPQFLMIEKFSLNKSFISKDDILKAFYLTHKNIGFFTEYTVNFEYKFRDGVSEALKKIDQNSSFNSLIFLFE